MSNEKILCKGCANCKVKRGGDNAPGKVFHVPALPPPSAPEAVSCDSRESCLTFGSKQARQAGGLFITGLYPGAAEDIES